MERLVNMSKERLAFLIKEVTKKHTDALVAELVLAMMAERSSVEQLEGYLHQIQISLVPEEFKHPFLAVSVKLLVEEITLLKRRLLREKRRKR